MYVYFEDFVSRVRESHPVAEDVVSLAPSQACFCLHKVSQQAGYDDKVIGFNLQFNLSCNMLPLQQECVYLHLILGKINAHTANF